MNKQVLTIIIVVVALALLAVGWYALKSRETTPSGAPAAGGPAAPAATPGSLAAEISDKSQNPIKGELPAADPGAGINPLEGVYQNPFGE